MNPLALWLASWVWNELTPVLIYSPITTSMVFLLEYQQSRFTLFQEGESNSEETGKKRNKPLRIPPLAESFVKEANSTAAEEETCNEEAVEEDESKESNSLKDLKEEKNTNADTINKNSAHGNSQSNETVKDSTGTNGGISENTEHSVQKSKNVNLHVKQNFGAINVGLEYSGDDVQPLEQNSEGEENVNVESGSESEDESEGEEEGSGNAEDDEQRDDIRAAYGKSG